MKTSPPWLRAHYTVDPDFDTLGGELSLAQIRDPLPAIHEKPTYYIKDGVYVDAYWRERDKLDRRWRRLRRAVARLERMQRPELMRQAKERLARAWKAFNLQRDARCVQWLKSYADPRFPSCADRSLPIFRFKGNERCNCCIPYNGRHTLNYWGTGQPDCW